MWVAPKQRKDRGLKKKIWVAHLREAQNDDWTDRPINELLGQKLVNVKRFRADDWDGSARQMGQALRARGAADVCDSIEKPGGKTIWCCWPIGKGWTKTLGCPLGSSLLPSFGPFACSRVQHTHKAEREKKPCLGNLVLERPKWNWTAGQKCDAGKHWELNDARTKKG